MTINLEDFVALSDISHGVHPFDDVYLYNGTGTASNSSTNIICSREVTEQIQRQLGDSVAVRFSRITGTVVLSASEFDNSRVVRVYKKSASSKISCRALVPTMKKLFGEHKYYGFNWRFDSISGGRGRALVLEPNGRWKD